MSRLITFISVALAAAAFAAPAALAQSASDQPRVDPLAVSELQGMGYTPAQIQAWTVGPCSQQVKPAACFGPSHGAGLIRPVVDPLAVSYLTGMGLTPAEVQSWTTGACSRAVKDASCFAVFDRGSAPVTTSASTTGFDWADAGIGAGATLGFLLLLGGTTAGLLISRQNRRQIASA
jgi:hypothetical protein